MTITVLNIEREDWIKPRGIHSGYPLRLRLSIGGFSRDQSEGDYGKTSPSLFLGKNSFLSILIIPLLQVKEGRAFNSASIATPCRQAFYVLFQGERQPNFLFLLGRPLAWAVPESTPLESFHEFSLLQCPAFVDLIIRVYNTFGSPGSSFRNQSLSHPLGIRTRAILEKIILICVA